VVDADPYDGRVSTDGGRSEPVELRIGDAERESAMQALSEHLSAGRIDIDEFGERSAKVTAARTRRELAALFTDLPEPHPTFGNEPVAVAKPVTTEGTVVEPAPAGNSMQRFAGALAGMTGVIWVATIAAIVATHIGWLIFIPIALSVCFGSAWGRGRHGYNHRYDRYERRRDRDERRGRYWD
jgi:uncharacterized protein DUF1707